MQESIPEHFASRTLITITHRTSAILDGDRVTVVSDGTVFELDPPGELLARDPLSQPGGLRGDIGFNQSSGILQEVS
ncbi:ABC transporter integral membrane type 1 [Penicillium concentricum]|uniref:ABC transporter integral membrane type 1 n=1 Tax=Penicillium concentricum TaxID=293559 RepID=A0A9W9S896_9EURO|nr:ABC transporter integral membrane type 1 [Penicillium concentricum]KAJ5373911.1 ABC transporter integral membrane type 1 [Penicillium concentricum]